MEKRLRAGPQDVPHCWGAELTGDSAGSSSTFRPFGEADSGLVLAGEVDSGLGRSTKVVDADSGT